MLDLDTGSPFRLENSTGEGWRRTPQTLRSGTFIFRFVGIGYSLNGLAQFRPGFPTEDTTELGSTNTYYAFQKQMDATRYLELEPGGSLGSFKDMELTAYETAVPFGTGSDIIFYNATVDIPVLTQA